MASKKAAKSVLDDEIVYEKREFEDDPNFMHQGKEITVVLQEPTKDKVVLKFSEDLPEGLAGKRVVQLEHDEIMVGDTPAIQFIDEMEADTWDDGTPKGKYAWRYTFPVKETETGREFKYDLQYRIDENGRPFKDFRQFLEMLGADFSDGAEFKIGNYVKIGMKFTCKLLLREEKKGKNKGKSFLHIDTTTLQPVYENVE